MAARSTLREKPGADSGAPRSGRTRCVMAHFPADGGGAPDLPPAQGMRGRRAVLGPADVQARGFISATGALVS